MRRLRAVLAVAGLPLTLASGAVSCFVFRGVETEPLQPRADSVVVTSPAKAHLLDGSTVVFAHGVTLVLDTLRGEGTRYDITLGNPTRVSAVALDSVATMESFRTTVNVPATVLVSAGATAAGVGLAALAAVAIFGSCPTFYADSAGTPVLEAEAFSYSIAPLFEARDVDRLGARVDPGGVLRLEMRNEAAETHYINQIELLEVAHEADEWVLPDTHGRPLAVGAPLEAAAARDRARRDLRHTLAEADGHAFRTARGVLAAAGPGDLYDWIELAFPAPDADSVVLVMRLRNSLLATVLLYEVMLGGQGLRALDWVGHDLNRIGSAIELGRWYDRRMGMRVSVLDGAAAREVARIRDVGPIAWKDVAVVVPAPPGGPGDSLRVRLDFVADNWRIDHVAVTARYRRPEVRTVPLGRILSADGADQPAALEHLSAPDDRYLETRPGQHFTLEFDAGESPRARTFLLAAQGYYIEWIRRSWIESARTAAFRPSDDALLAAVERWRAGQPMLERRFDETRIPVR